MSCRGAQVKDSKSLRLIWVSEKELMQHTMKAPSSQTKASLLP